MTTLVDEILDEPLLRQGLAERMGAEARITVVESQRLKSGVYRVRLVLDGLPRSVIAKRLAPEIAVRNRAVVERWLPVEGMETIAPRLLGVVAEPGATWLLSEDLGTRTLRVRDPDPERVDAAALLIARLHRRFAEHAVLGECRLWGGELGMPFHRANLRDAIYALKSLSAAVTPESERARLCERMLARLRALEEDGPRRAEAMQRWGGPETLLHGDLWPENLVEVPAGSAFEMRLIDWDHAGVGPALYDVSTFLFRFEPGERRRVWAAYRAAFGADLWRFPGEAELALLCETAEHARMANRVIWPALSALRGEGDAAFEELAQIEGWFEDLRPVLP